MNLQCEHLDAWLEGALPKEIKDDFESHLGVCDACRKAIQVDEQLDSLISTAWNSVDYSLTKSVEDKLGADASKKAHVGLRWAIAGSLAAALLTGALLLQNSEWAKTDAIGRKDDRGEWVEPTGAANPAVALRNGASMMVSIPDQPERNAILVPVRSNRKFTILKTFKPVVGQAKTKRKKEEL